MKILGRLLCNQAPEGGEGAGGGQGSSGAGGTGAEGGAGGAGQGGAGGQEPPTGAGGEPEYELDLGGTKVKKPLKDILAMAQQGNDYTQKTQKIAQREREFQKKLAQLDELIAEAEAQGKSGQPQGEDDPLKKTESRVERLESEQARLKTDRALAPIRQKYPDLIKDEFDEDMVIEKFIKMVDKGEAENSEAGMMAAAEAMADGRKGWFDGQLTEMSKNIDDPRMKAYNDKVIEAYLTRKRGQRYSGGEHGGAGGAGAGGAKPPQSIAEAAERARQQG